MLISGRQTNNIKDAVKKLASGFSTDKVDGSSCGISQYDQLSKLWEYAKGLFGQVDIWINNAGISNQQGFGALYNMEGMGANRRSANIKG